eukprot:6196229-Pleurochrysis_carterae.AAC.1
MSIDAIATYESQLARVGEQPAIARRCGCIGRTISLPSMCELIHSARMEKLATAMAKKAVLAESVAEMAI